MTTPTAPDRVRRYGSSSDFSAASPRRCDTALVEGRLGFRGGATLYRDREKTDVLAELFSGDRPDGSTHWWGTVSALSADEPLLDPGAAYVRFSDGTDAEIRLLKRNGENATFDVIELGTLEPDLTRWQGTRREASAQDPSRDWPKPAGT